MSLRVKVILSFCVLKLIAPKYLLAVVCGMHEQNEVVSSDTAIAMTKK